MSHILILGANSDLGKSLADRYEAQGDTVYKAGRQNCEFLFESANYEAHASFYDQFDPKPNGVVYVIGYMGDQSTSEKSFEETQKVVEANYLGALSILNIVANNMEARGEGFIVGISSVSGNRGRSSNYIYGSAKAGFTAYLSGLRNRLSRSGVHVLTVIPGFMSTKMTAHLILPNVLTLSAHDAASIIVKAQKTKKNIIYIKPIWRLIMCVISAIPERIFKRLNL